jgi:uncharacterized protein (TIGR00730 family)
VKGLKRVCVYCGSSDDVAPAYLAAASHLGLALARRGHSLVYGGGGTGLMGALARAALEAGGEVIGVIPQGFNTPQLLQPNLSRLHVVDSMHARKAMMAEMADGFIALPGGFGTFEELFEILTWAQIGLHSHPIGLLDVRHYFGQLIALIEQARGEGFIYAEHRALLLWNEDPDTLLDDMAAYVPPSDLSRWVERPAGGSSGT